MLNKFKSKRDTSGNVYTIEVNHESKTYKRSYNIMRYDDFITVDKKELNNIENQLIKANYTEIF